ncbi:hypothetical protein LQ567_07025 [Niabella pedocola]|uniref:Uncharacterized protein n=1 Tax=Niabella pedocola TaxID=1752077 RepID=A0ABS8PN35_9BACT|nr:hypothetical protein [Niabella pedocola]MCD2422510.1 hypothetical protein [Niabella pedocola]
MPITSRCAANLRMHHPKFPERAVAGTGKMLHGQGFGFIFGQYGDNCGHFIE